MAFLPGTAVGRRLLILAVGRSPRRTLARVLVLGLASFIIFRYLLLPVRISGTSMEPTYRDRSVNLVNTLRYRFRPPRRGEVAVIAFAGRRVMLLKRIVGLPGERISFQDGRLFINGRLVEEPYLVKSCRWNLAEEAIGPDEFFVVGDNRSMPIEEHTHGRVKRARLVGAPLW